MFIRTISPMGRAVSMARARLSRGIDQAGHGFAHKKGRAHWPGLILVAVKRRF
jgi:hypothetical protein